MHQQTIARELDTPFAGRDALDGPRERDSERWPLPYAALFIGGASVAAWALLILVGMAILG